MLEASIVTWACGEEYGRWMQVKAVQEYMEELLEADQKFLVFYHHKVMGEGLQEVLNKWARPPLLLCVIQSIR